MASRKMPTARRGLAIGARTSESERSQRLVGLQEIAERWSVSRQTVRRILTREGVRPVYLGGGARNATLRFRFSEVVSVEDRSQSA